MDTRFRDRTDAGRQLARELRDRDLAEPVVLGLPRGGLPVAHEVARELDAPLDVVVVRKIGAPSNPEFALGAIGEEGVEILDEDSMRSVGVTRQDLEPTIEQEREELRRRLERYRGERRGVDVAGRSVVLVDDGIATGSTATAAGRILRARGAARVTLAVPVGPARSVDRLRDRFDDVVILLQPEGFMAVGSWYERFDQTTDHEVEEILGRYGRTIDSVEPGPSGGPGAAARSTIDATVAVRLGDVELAGHLTVPADATAAVIFAHGSGSSRHSPRNQAVATALNDAGLATLLFDLLTEAEGADRTNVFDIGLLGRRVAETVDWARRQDELAGLPIGLFGASTGAAAALEAAAHRPETVGAVVSRGGRVDLARRRDEVEQPVLLIVGGDDTAVLEMNRDAARDLRRHELEVVDGAGHLFEGPGELEAVADLAARFLARHLAVAA